MTLSANLSNLRRDKQMFKYPARAAGSGSARWDRSRIRARVDAVPALKQVQKQRIVAGKTHYSRPATFVASEKNNRGAAASQTGARSSPQPAQSSHVAARCCSPTSPIHDPTVSKAKNPGELSVRKKDAAPGDQVSTAAVGGVCVCIIPSEFLSHNSRADARFRGQGSLLVRNISPPP